jgi:hypothetical protein
MASNMATHKLKLLKRISVTYKTKSRRNTPYTMQTHLSYWPHFTISSETKPYQTVWVWEETHWIVGYDQLWRLSLYHADPFIVLASFHYLFRDKALPDRLSMGRDSLNSWLRSVAEAKPIPCRPIYRIGLISLSLPRQSLTRPSEYGKRLIE